MELADFLSIITAVAVPGDVVAVVVEDDMAVALGDVVGDLSILASCACIDN